MNGKIFKLLPSAFNALYKDKVNFLLMIVPVIIGLILYAVGIGLAYDFFKGWLDGILKNHINSETMGQILYYLIGGILTVLCLFLVNWTFVLLTSLIASPFNDFISSRIAKKIKGQQQESLDDSYGKMFKKMFRTFANELKKITIIAAISIIAVVFGYIPLLTPIAILVAFVLISIQFVDYSWSRDRLHSGACFKDVISNLFFYLLSGAFFFLIINIPVINIMVPSFATSFYTIYWENRKKK